MINDTWLKHINFDLYLPLYSQEGDSQRAVYDAQQSRWQLELHMHDNDIGK